MNCKLIIVTLVGVFSTASLCKAAEQASSSPRFSVGASGAYGFFGDFDNGAGAVVDARVVVSGPHSVVAEAGFFDSGTDLSYVSKVRFFPIVGGYRYTAAVTPASEFFVSALAGTVVQSASFSSSTLNDNSFSYGAKIGFSGKISETLWFDMSATGLYVGSSDVVTSGNISYVSAGLSVRF